MAIRGSPMYGSLHRMALWDIFALFIRCHVRNCLNFWLAGPGMIRARSHASPGNLRTASRSPRRAPGRAGQESRSSGHRGATSLITMDDITIHATFLPHDDPDASLAFYRDVLGFEVRNDVGYGGLRWITVGPPGQP